MNAFKAPEDNLQKLMQPSLRLMLFGGRSGFVGLCKQGFNGRDGEEEKGESAEFVGEFYPGMFGVFKQASDDGGAKKCPENGRHHKACEKNAVVRERWIAHTHSTHRTT